jgi:hypothetical protein
MVLVAVASNLGGFLLLRKQGRSIDVSADATIAEKAMAMLDKWEARANKLERMHERNKKRIDDLQEANGVLAQVVKMLAGGVFVLTSQLEAIDGIEPEWVVPEELKSVLEHQGLFNL